jgi:hypothetical protein
MAPKKIIVMGSMPIAGVIWQLVHCIVGLQRLGHQDRYVAHPGRSSYSRATLLGDGDFEWAPADLRYLGGAFGSISHWAFCVTFPQPVQRKASSLDCARALSERSYIFELRNLGRTWAT